MAKIRLSITAGIVTAITSFYFTGSLAAAAAIVGWDLGTKSISMFIGERLWNKSDWGKDEEAGADSAKRSLVKALAWRAFAAVNTFIGATVLVASMVVTLIALLFLIVVPVVCLP